MSILSATKVPGAAKGGLLNARVGIVLAVAIAAVVVVLVNTITFVSRSSSFDPLHLSEGNVHVEHRLTAVKGKGYDAYVLPHEPGAMELTPLEKLVKNAVVPLSARECGSPAVDGYMHVEPPCLEASPTNKWYQDYYAAGGKHSDLIARIELAADYDGLAVGWGIGNKKESIEACAQACLDHEPKPGTGPFAALPCNAFAWCSDENGCFEPDAHTHTYGDCWLKFTEGPVVPEVNMRGDLPEDFRQRHPNAPERVQWHTGVLLPDGTPLTEGTMGPRFSWKK